MLQVYIFQARLSTMYAIYLFYGSIRQRMQAQNVFSNLNYGQLNKRLVLSLTIHVYWLSKKSGPKGPGFGLTLKGFNIT